METPIFRIIEEELLSCREKIDTAIQALNEIDAQFTDKPALAVRLAQVIIKYEDTQCVVEKLLMLQWRVNVGNFEQDKQDK
ncbi:MAG: hypothetical protein V7K21_14120 [Nostoc sp.]|uniref:hypothetical protein n=1 Tax=Nostoc sp. TaxID=1180 RepID=UPI002FFA4620